MGVADKYLSLYLCAREDINYYNSDFFCLDTHSTRG